MNGNGFDPYFPDNDVVLSLRSDADLKSLSLTPMQKKLLYLLTLKKPIPEIILEAYGSDFLVCYELFQLYEMNLIEILEMVRPPAEPESPAKLFNKGLEFMQSHKYQEGISGIPGSDPARSAECLGLRADRAGGNSALPGVLPKLNPRQQDSLFPHSGIFVDTSQSYPRRRLRRIPHQWDMGCEIDCDAFTLEGTGNTAGNG